MPQSYIDIATKRQAILERLKSATTRDFIKAFTRLDKILVAAMAAESEEVSELGTRDFNNLIRIIQQDQGNVFDKAIGGLLKTLETISKVTAAQEFLDLNNAIDLRNTRLKKFTSKDIFANVVKTPLATDGDLLKPFLKNFTNRRQRVYANTIRLGHSQGLTNREIMARIVGTKKNKFKDGLTAKEKRDAATIVHTSLQHVASAARQEVWTSNEDVIKRYKFVATLDRSTSNVCRTLDGQEFDFGKGPIPPVHPNCRSTTIPILADDLAFLSKGRTRSAEKGPVSADKGYYDWLKNQGKETQVEVLGRDRAKLFRDGGMTAEKFRALQFDKNFKPLTLAEMKQQEPKAFEMAGL